jgi:hypothetical protein
MDAQNRQIGFYTCVSGLDIVHTGPVGLTEQGGISSNDNNLSLTSTVNTSRKFVNAIVGSKYQVIQQG